MSASTDYHGRCQMGSVFRKGSKETGQSAGSSNALQAASADMINQGRPLRTEAFGQLGGFLKSGQLPSALTGGIGTNEQELAAAKAGILRSGVRGGQMRQSLAQLPLQRLQMRDSLRSGAFDTALSAGLGSFNAGSSGMQGAASNLNSLGSQRMQQNKEAKQGAGKVLGQAYGGISDRRLKSNIVRLSTHPSGLAWYEYMIDGHYDQGVMAQEARSLHPEAVSRHPSGYLQVHYGLLPGGAAWHS